MEEIVVIKYTVAQRKKKFDTSGVLTLTMTNTNPNANDD
jgi:hypothetical protein